MVCHGFIGKLNQKSFKHHKYGRRKTRRQHHHESKFSAATVEAAGSMLKSLNMSIFTFHNRLFRCVSKFFCIATTGSVTSSHRATKKQGYKKLGKHEQPQQQQPPLRIRNVNKRTIFLDLDETLVHTTMEPPMWVDFDFTVRIKIEGALVPMYVVKRPGVTEFLERIGKNYRVVVFTAGLQEYASQVLDKLDKNRVISQRLYRDSCTEIDGKYAKDLSLVAKKDLGSVLLVDDNPFAYSLQPDNGIPIKPFVDDMEDQELMKLVEFFDGCYQYEDLRDAATEFMSNKLI